MGDSESAMYDTSVLVGPPFFLVRKKIAAPPITTAATTMPMIAPLPEDSFAAKQLGQELALALAQE